MEHFNSQILFDNIEFLIKSENRKIGEVESAAGVSAGYISRTSKDGGSKPGIDFIMNIAKVLHVSIDTLLKVEIASLTPTEKYLISFLEKLEHDTTHDLLTWNRESKEHLREIDVDREGFPEHPLFEFHRFHANEKGEYPQGVSRVVFASRLFGVDTAINGDCFNLRMKNNAHLYLMNISKIKDQSGNAEGSAIEVWMQTQSNTQYLCNDYGNSKLKDYIDNLYAVVSESTKHPKVEPDVRYIIDSFMKNDNDDDPPTGFDEEIPF